MNCQGKDVKYMANDAACQPYPVRRRPTSVAAECALLIVGLICAAIFVVARMEGYVVSRQAIEQFETSTQAVGLARVAGEQTDAADQPDFSGWSEGRARAYADAAQQGHGIAMAVLEIPRLELKAPVFDGTDELTLNHGLGLIDGTAWPGGSGNIGIAGHRDGFFRKLKNIRRGDEIALATRSGTDIYVADKIQIVIPLDVSVLGSESEPSLTLVTCYPFYSIGGAPKRFVVKAHLKRDDRAASRLNTQPLNPSLEEQ